MTTNDPTETLVFPAHQSLSARLVLAAVDEDNDRFGQCLTEVIDGQCAVEIISLMAKHLSLSLVAQYGPETARTVLQRTILNAGQASQ